MTGTQRKGFCLLVAALLAFVLYRQSVAFMAYKPGAKWWSFLVE